MSDNEENAKSGTKRRIKRSSARTTDKTIKKAKASPTKRSGADATSRNNEKISPSKSSTDDISSQELAASNDSYERAASIEERRRALQAEKLRKQKEMEALEAEEEALLRAEAAAANADEREEKTLEDIHYDSTNPSADEFDVRSDAGSQSDHHSEKHGGEVGDENGGPDEPSFEGRFIGSDEDQEFVELHNDDDDDDDGDDDDDDDENNENNGDDSERQDDNKRRAISPVTWDVDVHANDENISDDSPLPSNDEGSDVEKGEIEDNVDQDGKSESKNGKKTPKSERRSSSRLSDKKSPVDAEVLRPRVNKYLYKEAKYFMVKSNNHENVRLAKAKGVWSTPPQNEIRFNKAINDSTTVILVFSVKESGAFQGFARINGSSQKDGPKINWVLPPGISAKALSGVFKLDWVSRTDLLFEKAMHLRNPWNMNKPVKIARDGQEIEPHIGEQLCKLFTLDGSSDYERVISRIKKKRESLQAQGGSKPSTRTTQRDVPYSSKASNRNIHSNHRGGIRSQSSYNRNPPLYHPRHGPGPGPHFSGSYDPYYSGNRAPYDRRSGPAGHPPYPQANHQYSSSNYSDIIAKGSYEEYLNEMRRAGNVFADMGSMHLGDPYMYHAGGRDTVPPNMSAYSASRDRDRIRPNSDRYEKDVEEFLRRTGGSSRHHRSENRGSDRYKESRDYRRERVRSRSRERERHRERR